MTLRTTLIAMIVTLGLLPATAMPARAQLQVSDTGVPMINQDERHTGQSRLLGPLTSTVDWTLQLYDKWTTAAVAADGTIYAGAGWSLCAANPDGTNKWLNPGNGAKCQLLQADVSVSDSPAIDIDGYVYIGARDNILRAFKDDGDHATQVCSYLVHHDGDITGSPAIAPDGTVYFTFNQGGRLYSAKPARECGDPTTIDPVVRPIAGGGFTINWVFFGGSDVAGSSPASIASDRTVYYGTADGKVHALNPAEFADPAVPTERAGWPVSVGTMITNSSPSIAADGTIYIGSSAGVTALRPDGTKLWTFPTLGRVDNTVVIGRDGTIYFGSRMAAQNTVYALNPGSCQPLPAPIGCQASWTYPLSVGATYSAFLTIGADDIVYAAIGTKLVALGVGGAVLWQHTFPQAVTSYPVLGNDGTLYIGNKGGWNLYAFGPGRGIPDPVDLIETSVGGFPPTAEQGATINVTDTATNLGAAAAGSTSTTRYYLSSDGTTKTKLLTGAGRSVPALAANGSPGDTSSESAPATIPLRTVIGNYFVLACADDLHAVIETDETNNCVASATQISVTQGPQITDLVETSVSNPPATAAVNSSFTVTDTTENAGNVDVGTSTTLYYLSSDTAKSAGDVLLTGSRSVPALIGGAQSSGSASVTIPGSTAPGPYFLLACANDTGTVSESSGYQTNNCIASNTAVQVTGLADLVVAQIGDPPATVGRTKTFQVGTTVTNQGLGTAAASKTQYYLGLNPSGLNPPQRSSGDRLLSGFMNVPSLSAPPSTSATGTATLTVPSVTALGTYYLFGCADDVKIVKESDETNNCTAAATQVQVTP